MTFLGNNFVDYLNRFTTVSPEHEAAFDEFIGEIVPPGEPLKLNTKTETFLRDLFNTDHPPSIILTGNAGDGKTYLCRQIIEAFGRGFDGWPEDEIEWTIHRGSTRLHIVKDLSETDEEKGLQILQRLQALLQDNEKPSEGFLIAANEGRLRAILSSTDQLTELRRQIDSQLQLDVPQTTEASSLIVLNLNKTTVSSHVPAVLQWISEDEHWKSCEDCPALAMCPIRYNASKIRQDLIKHRIKQLYQILEHLGYHLTIRDMLMHLSYVVTAGLICDSIIVPDDPDKWNEQSPLYAYHENIWGENATARLKRKVLAIHHLRQLNPGQMSIFEIDREILDENPNDQFSEILKSTPGNGYKYFSQVKEEYRRGTISQQNEKTPSEEIVTRWLPFYRRNVFLEHEAEHLAMRLLPFIYASDYFELIRGARNQRIRQVRNQLVHGLNRAFSNLFLGEANYLYVTAQYAHSAEQPIPIVKMRVPIDNVELKVRNDSTQAIDRDYSNMTLEIFPPRNIYGSEPKEVWPINLLVFEYLMRRNDGGTANILANECELSIRRLKNRLLTRAFESNATPTSKSNIEFFAVVNNRYKLQELIIEGD